MEFYFSSPDVDRLIAKLSASESRMMRSGFRWVRKLTGIAERKMKQFSRAKTSRSTGKLSTSIKSFMSVGGQSVKGIAYVPDNIPHRFATEYGFRVQKKLVSNKFMKFPASSWKKARQGAAVGRSGIKGYYVFYGITRGRYKGKAYRKRAFEKVLVYYRTNKHRIAKSLGNAIILK